MLIDGVGYIDVSIGLLDEVDTTLHQLFAQQQTFSVPT